MRHDRHERQALRRAPGSEFRGSAGPRRDRRRRTAPPPGRWGSGSARRSRAGLDAQIAGEAVECAGGIGPERSSRNLAQSSGGLQAVARARASSSTGWRRGRIGGTTIQLRPARFSRGMTPARSSEDLPDPDEPKSAISLAPPWARRASSRSIRRRMSSSRPK